MRGVTRRATNFRQRGSMKMRSPIRSRASVVLTSLILIGSFAAGSRASAQDNSQVAQHLNEGYKYLRESNYTDAITSFKRAVVADPKNARARLDLAYTLLTTGQDSEAIE